MSDETQAVETTSTPEPAAAEPASTPVPESSAAPSPPMSPTDALRAAAKKLQAPEPAKPAKPAAQGKPRDPAGKFTAATEPKPDATPGKPQEAAQPAPGAPDKAEPEKPVAHPFRGPQSWSPAAREALSKADPVVQSEVAKRERDYQQGIQQHAERAKVGDAFREALKPFEGMIAAEGSDPIRATVELHRTAAFLRTAPLPQRAQMLGSMIRTFLGTDDNAVALLAQALDGGAQGPARAPAQPQIDPRAIVEQVKASILQERMGELTERRRAELEKFAETHEFFADVQPEMALAVQAAVTRGRPVDLEAIYNVACMVNPEIAPLVKQREAAKAAATAQVVTQRTEAAASSVRSQPGVSPGRNGTGDLSREDAIRQAAAAVAGRGRV